LLLCFHLVSKQVKIVNKVNHILENEYKKFLLQEKDIPTAWYNIAADMKNKPLPILNPKTKETPSRRGSVSSFRGRACQTGNESD